MSATSKAFWKRVGLGQRRKHRKKTKRPKRTLINVVMIESSINRNTRCFQFPAQRPPENEWVASASVVVGLPGKVALSELCWDEDKLKFKCRYIGQYGRSYYKELDTYASEHASNCKPSLVVAVDCDGLVLSSRDLYG